MSTSCWPLRHGPVIALLAIGVAVGCSDVPRASSAASADHDAYIARAEAICRVGRARLREDPSLRDSTTVLADMERQLRELGQPPQALDALGPDVPASLARITWAAESFDAAGRYDLDGIVITVDRVRALGFRVCGTR